MKPYTLICISILLPACFIHLLTFAYGRCGFDFLKKPKKHLIHQDSQSLRGLKDADWESLRIHFDYSLIENKLDKIDKNDLRDIKEHILPKAQYVLQSLLKVKRFNNKLKLPEGMTCGNIVIPEKYMSEGIDADVIIFVLIADTSLTMQNPPEAAAVHCAQDDLTNRPLVGFVDFKSKLQVNNSTAADYMTWLALHEISHILVFNSDLFEDWINEAINPVNISRTVAMQTAKNGRKMYIVKSPNVVQRGREHFNCSTIKGVPLEYNGSGGTAGSHWSKKYMNTDYMIGDSYGENLISDITLAMFEDSGWYKPNYELANLFLWGKNSGCQFFNLNKKCVETTEAGVTTIFKSEFCTRLNYPICSSGFIFRGNCRGKEYTSLIQSERYFADPKIAGIDKYSDKCPIAVEVKRGQKYYGGSCRVGSSEMTQSFEKICPECACFMSSLREKIIPSTKMLRSRVRPSWEKMNFDIDKEDTYFTDRISFRTSFTSDPFINVTDVTDADEFSEYIDNLKINATEYNGTFMTLPELTENDLSAHCLEYKCESSKLFVIVNRRKYECKEHTPLTIEGYLGSIQCPSASILCHPKFRCKFGCVKIYSNADEFKLFP